MAYASGTATDFIDFLRKLRDYSAGLIDPASHATITGGIIVPTADRWTIQTLGGGMTALPGSGSATDGEFYLQGQGSDPSDQIQVGFQTYRNVGNAVFGFRMRGYTAYNSALTFTTMPGVSPQTQVALSNASMNCWFWVSARRIMALARVGTTDILLHVGFIRQFGTRSQYPYPLMLCGSVRDETFNTAQNNFGQSSLPDPCELTCYLRWVDGTWQQMPHYSGVSSQRGQQRTGVSPGTTTYAFWPQRNVTINNRDGSNNSTIDNEEQLFEQFSSTNRQVSSSEIGAYPLLPIIAHQQDQLIGTVDGLYMVPGLGLNSGDTINDGTDTYDVFKNTWRSETDDFFCIRRA